MTLFQFNPTIFRKQMQRSLRLLIGSKYPSVPLSQNDETNIRMRITMSPLPKLLEQPSLIRLVRMNGIGCFVFYEGELPYSISFPITPSPFHHNPPLTSLVDIALCNPPIVNLHFRDYDHAICFGFPADHHLLNLDAHRVVYTGDVLEVKRI